MAKRTDIKKILIIGSGPIVIGQAAEFDYAGTQACLPLQEERYEVVLVNSNPATIMTDPETAKFLANVRDLAKRAQASVTGADVGIPTQILPLLTENRYRYSKLYNRVMVRTVRGEAHQPIAGLAPEAIYMDCCDALNELNFSYSMVPVTCHMLGGFVMICNLYKP